MSDTEKTLVQKARELTKLQAKRTAAALLVEALDAQADRVKAEIATLLQAE